jgi:hypothetical protein
MLKRSVVTGIAAGTMLAAMMATTTAASVIDDAVDKMDEGTIRLQFESRDGVCGDGRHSISFGGEDSWYVSDGHYDDWERDCDEGPVRVSMRIRDGKVVRVKTRVGGTPKAAGDGIVDLGDVPPETAADYFLGLARNARESVAEDAILPAILARDVVVWPDVLEIARDGDRPEDVRESAVFWLGQLAGEKATEGLKSIVEDDDEDMEVREAAVFALSQGNSRKSTGYLMEIARNNPHPELRRNAMFWLEQNDTP